MKNLLPHIVFFTLLHGLSAKALADSCQHTDLPPAAPTSSAGGIDCDAGTEDANGNPVTPSYAWPVYRFDATGEQQTVHGKLTIQPKQWGLAPLDQNESEALARFVYVMADGSYATSEKRVYLQRLLLNGQLRYRVLISSAEQNNTQIVVPRVLSGGALELDIFFRWSSGGGGNFGNVLICFMNDCQMPSFMAPNVSTPLRLGRVNGFNGSDNNSFHWLLTAQ